MTAVYSLYIATNVVNGRQYIGLTKEYQKRLISHKCAKTKSVFHEAIRQHGFDKFVFSHIADAFDLEAACDLERMLIQQHNTLTPNGYNMTVGGQIGPVGYKHNAESKAKIAEANRNRNPEVKEKFRLAKVGVKQTDAFKSNARAKSKEVWSDKARREAQSLRLKESWAKRRLAKEQADRLLHNLSLENCHD
jgi:group I intron endonuclease